MAIQRTEHFDHMQGAPRVANSLMAEFAIISDFDASTEVYKYK
jgi:hypothetical protein